MGVVAAEEALGTSWLRETIEHAFLEVLRARARREDLEALSEMRGLNLADPQVIGRAWTSES